LPVIAIGNPFLSHVSGTLLPGRLVLFSVAPVLSFGVTDTLLSNRIPLVWVTVRSFIIIHSPWGIQSRGGRYDDRFLPREDTSQHVCEAAVSEEKNYVENDCIYSTFQRCRLKTGLVS
jgi:hypothetical protein